MASLVYERENCGGGGGDDGGSWRWLVVSGGDFI